MGCCGCCAHQDYYDEIKELDEDLVDLKSIPKAATSSIPTPSPPSSDDIIRDYLSGFYQSMHTEQKSFSAFIHSFIEYLGNAGQYIHEIGINTKINQMRDSQGTDKMKKYMELRMEETDMEKRLIEQLVQVAERLHEIDNEKAEQLKDEFNLLFTLVDETNPLKSQIEVLKAKEDEYLSQKGMNLAQTALRFVNRIKLERELTSIKIQLVEKSQGTGVDLNKLREIEEVVEKAFKLSINNLQKVSEEITGKEYDKLEGIRKKISETYGFNAEGIMESIKHKTEAIFKMQAEVSNYLNENSVENKIKSLERKVKEIVENLENKRRVYLPVVQKAFGINEKYSPLSFNEEELKYNRGGYKSVSDLHIKITELLVAVSDQDNYLVKTVEGINEFHDKFSNVDAQLQDLIKQEIRDLSNTISLENSELRENLERIKTLASELEIDPSMNIIQYTLQISERMKIMDDIDTLRKHARDIYSRDSIKLKSSFNEMLNEMESKKSLAEAEQEQLQTKIKALEHSAEKDKELINKYTQMNSDQELEITKLKNSLSTLTVENQEFTDKISSLEEENESLEKNEKKMKKNLREKENEVREASEKIAVLEEEVGKLKVEIHSLKEALDKKESEVEVIE
ncbi:unnamed protein product [Blepharisma stoltei]|uniref:Uncharacterized protein n=1 Tax=Blepharisma stoltei TaxID=1481888 RepID=A0AAU9JEC7_9CILI|nr:unnamed protein product [Blepharisma stoltei]